jgi:hypothetical protein
MVFFNKTRNLLFAIGTVLIYINYGDRTIIAIIICDVRRRIRHLFITFAVNLLNRPTDGATVRVRKSPSEKQLLFVQLGVRKIIFYIKGA